MLEVAIELAKKLHKGQKRKTGEEYVAHPISVMEILKRYDFPEEALVCWVLHDICEDTELTNIDLREMFGDRVGFIINALTKNQKPKNNEKLKAQYKEAKEKAMTDCVNFEEFFDSRFHLYINRFSVGIVADPWIMFIKMADQIHNAQTLDVFSIEKKQRKIREVEQNFFPVYARMKELVTPMYMPKYDGMLGELKAELDKHKQ